MHWLDDDFGRLSPLVWYLSPHSMSKRKCLSFSKLKFCQHCCRFMRQCSNPSWLSVLLFSITPSSRWLFFVCTPHVMFSWSIIDWKTTYTYGAFTQKWMDARKVVHPLSRALVLMLFIHLSNILRHMSSLKACLLRKGVLLLDRGNER